MQWYYTINRERFGPVDEYEIRNLIATGKIKNNDLLWNVSLGEEWKPASELFPHLYVGTINGPMDHRPPGANNGTGGMTANGTLTANARTALTGKWGITIGGMLLYMAISMGISIASSLIPIIGNFIQLFLYPPLIVGIMLFFLTITRGKKCSIEQLFSGFKCFWPAVGAYVMSTLFVLLWMLPGLLIMLVGLFFMPETGISQYLPELPFEITSNTAMTICIAGGVITWLSAVIVSLRYSQIYLVLADNPEAGVFGSISSSIELMKGKKWKYIFLGLRFFGWALLAMFTLGIGFIWLYPYMMTAYAGFYEDLKQ
jgi:uncharacterized membrane protein